MIRRLCLVAATAALLAGCSWVDSSLSWLGGGGPVEDPANPGYTTTGEPIDATTGALRRPSLAVPPMLRNPDPLDPAAPIP